MQLHKDKLHTCITQTLNSVLLVIAELTLCSMLICLINKEKCFLLHSFHVDYLKHLPKESEESKDTESKWQCNTFVTSCE